MRLTLTDSERQYIKQIVDEKLVQVPGGQYKVRDKKLVLVESGDEEQIEETLVEGNVPRLCRTRSMLAMLPIFQKSSCDE